MKQMIINANDIKIIRQRILDLRIKIDIYDKNTNEHLDQFECGLINGNITINAESDVRTTMTLAAVPVKNKRLRLGRDSIIWLNRIAKASIGIYDIPNQKWHWYEQGDFVFSSYGITYDAATNELSLSASDKMALLDGTKNGQLGALIISYPAYEEDMDTGEVIKYNYIRDAVITTLTQLGKITDYEVDDIGEFKGMPEYNNDYLKYREESMMQVKDGTHMPTWNALPFDQEFSAGCSVLSILTAFRDLYPNYEMYFDKNGIFCCNMIPSRYDDDVVFDNDFFDKIFISENTTVDLSTIRNVCEVWGSVIETDFYTEQCDYAGSAYSCTVEKYDRYYNGDIVAVKIPESNGQGSQLNINGCSAIPIIDENTENPIQAGMMEAGQVYAFKIKKKRVNNQDVTNAYLLGQWQPHGINVLTNGSISGEDYALPEGNGASAKKYSKEYFQAVYNCRSVEFSVVPDSPYCVQELGEVLDVKAGGEYDNITSDSLALARAEYENWKNCRLTDSISITTKICPFADVNIKVEYLRKDTNEISQYIVKSLSHDLSGGTTAWQLMRFYPLYMETEPEKPHIPKKICTLSFWSTGDSWEDNGINLVVSEDGAAVSSGKYNISQTISEKPKADPYMQVTDYSWPNYTVKAINDVLYNIDGTGEVLLRANETMLANYYNITEIVFKLNANR